MEQKRSRTRKQPNNSGFLVQGSILAVASILSRIIGLLYRGPLTHIIGDLGNDYYSTAFEIYSLLLLISSMSLPLAVSKMVSARVSQGRVRDAYRVFKAALGFAVLSGALAGLAVFFFADFFAEILKTPFCVFALRVLAPTLFIVAVLGVIRGFFQGLGTMMPSAVSQIVEQVINAIVSVLAAYYLFAYGAKIGAVLGDEKEYSAAYGAAGGTLGTGAGAVAGLLFVLFVFVVYKRVLKRKLRRDHGNSRESYRTILKVLMLTVIPVLLSTTLYNLSAIVDQGIFKNVAHLQGYTADEIHVFWGVFGGKYRVLVNVPISIASAVVSASVPAITSSFAKKDMDSVHKKTENAIQYSMVVAFPCAIAADAAGGRHFRRVLFALDALKRHFAGCQPHEASGHQCRDRAGFTGRAALCPDEAARSEHFCGHLGEHVFRLCDVRLKRYRYLPLHRLPPGGQKDVFAAGALCRHYGRDRLCRLHGAPASLKDQCAEHARGDRGWRRLVFCTDARLKGLKRGRSALVPRGAKAHLAWAKAPSVMRC